MARKPFGRKGSWRSRASALGVVLALSGCRRSRARCPLAPNRPVPQQSRCRRRRRRPPSRQRAHAPMPTRTSSYTKSRPAATTPVAGGPCSGGAYGPGLPAGRQATPSRRRRSTRAVTSARCRSRQVTVTVSSNQLVTYGDFGGVLPRPTTTCITTCLVTKTRATRATSSRTAVSSAVPSPPASPSSGTPGYWFPTNTSCPAGSSPAGAGTVEWDGDANGYVGPYPDYDGDDNFVELNSNCVNGITQTIATVPGVQYTLTFRVCVPVTHPQADVSAGVQRTTTSRWSGAAPP